MWVEILLNDIILGKKVGLSADKAPQRNAATVKVYVKKMEDIGRLVLKFIDTGLTSVIRVCDLDGNKPLKINIKRPYLKYRADFIKAERAKYTGEPNKRVQMKIPVEDMMDISENSLRDRLRNDAPLLQK